MAFRIKFSALMRLLIGRLTFEELRYSFNSPSDRLSIGGNNVHNYLFELLAQNAAKTPKKGVSNISVLGYNHSFISMFNNKNFSEITTPSISYRAHTNHCTSLHCLRFFSDRKKLSGIYEVSHSKLSANE